MPYGGTKSRYRATEAAALVALADLVSERDHPIQTGRQSAMTFRTWAERWMAQADLSPGSLRAYRNVLANHVYPVIGGIQVARLSQADVLAMLARIDSRGGTAARRAFALKLTRNILSRAMQTTPPMVRANVALTIPTPRSATFTSTPPTDSDLVAILQAAHGHPLVDGPTYLAFRLLTDTGLRIGEVLGLQWADIGETTVTVRATLDGQSRLLSQTKTPKSRRTIRLSAPVRALVEAQRRAQVEAGQVSTYVMARRGRDGMVSPLRAGAVRKSWAGACQAAGVPPCRIHDVRHAVATRYLAAAVPMAVVSAHLGHARIATTVDTYGHLAVNAMDLTAYALDLDQEAAK
jgi:integrase